MTFLKSTLIVITGASKGIGRACAVAFAKDPRFHNIHLALLARSRDGLAQTEAFAVGERAQLQGGDNVTVDGDQTVKQISTSIHCIDLSDLTSLEEGFRKVLNQCEGIIKAKDEKGQCSRRPYHRAILINNAGSTGYLGPSHTLPPPTELQSYLDLNVTSSLWISSYFLQRFSGLCDCTIVNMSSLCAIEPFKTMGMYCAGKAARDLFHKTLAEEQNANANENCTTTRILNYAPGAIETEMSDGLANCTTLDSNVRQFFQTSKEEKTFIQPHRTAERMVNLIVRDDYDNGTHVDYWDLEEDSVP